MNSVQQIEAAIRLLSPVDRQKLVEVLPSLLPELDGDARWERIIHDAKQRPTLEKLLDEAQAEYAHDQKTFRETVRRC